MSNKLIFADKESDQEMADMEDEEESYKESVMNFGVCWLLGYCCWSYDAAAFTFCRVNTASASQLEGLVNGHDNFSSFLYIINDNL